MAINFRTILLGAAVSLLAAQAAYSDQFDPRLDELFAELRTGDEDDAAQATERIFAIWSDAQSDTVDVLYARAELSANLGEFDVAGALLDHAIGLSPSFAQAYMLRGVVRLSAADREGAFEDFARAVELEPRHFEARVALAELAAGNGEKREAFDMLQTALELDPHHERARERARALRRELEGQGI